MEIQAERFLLRPWQPGDEAALVRHGDNRKVWRNLTNRFPHPYRREDAEQWIVLNQGSGEPTRNFAIVIDGEAVGGVGLEGRADLAVRSAEIGYWLGEAFWGRGLATEAARCIAEHAFARFEFERLEAGVLAWNPASCRVLEKAGFQLESIQRKGAFKDGELIDSHLYVRFRS